MNGSFRRVDDLFKPTCKGAAVDILFQTIAGELTKIFGRQPTLNELVLIPMVPVFVMAFVSEWVYARVRSGQWMMGQHQPFWLREVVTNFTLGMGYYIANALMNLIYLAAVWAALWEHRLFDIPLNAFTLLAAFFVQEFCYYWYHRTAHRVRWFWAQHVPHHTGEIMNMSTAARQSILTGVIGTWMFYVPAILLGFSPDLILGLLGANLAYQWFIHTESVKKFHPAIEWLFNTPSNHRVHHGRNPMYIDKNYGGVTMLFDHLFGTYQSENEKVVYGIPLQIKSHNCLVLNLHELVDMVRDVMAPGPLFERLKHVWKPPGWVREGHAPIHTWTVERQGEPGAASQGESASEDRLPR
ncbi:MAG TPA: sterol desaturase family protein [Limnobacter sp.]|nr:sterol desaturase family protein [Limnobacter sp.]